MIFLLLLLSIFGFISVPILRWLWFTSPIKGMYGKKLYASCEFSKVYWIVLTEWVNTQNWEETYQKMITKSSKNLMTITLAWYRYKQKKNLWATFQTTVHSTQSQNLVSKLIAAISIKLVFVKLPPGQALNLCVKFSKFLFLTASSLSLSLI